MEVEVWKDVEGYEGVYQVSNTGFIKSLARRVGNVNRPETIFTPKITKEGYLRITLCRDNRKVYRFVHRLVAIAFVANPKPDEYNVVHHKDKNTLNSKADNLEWCNAAINNKYAFDMGRPPVKSWEGKRGYEHNKSMEVLCITHNKRFGSAREAARILGCGQSYVSQVCRGKLRHTKGLVFRYI